MSKGYEVLYLTDAIDEATITNLQKFGDYQLTDVSKEGLEVGGRMFVLCCMCVSVLLLHDTMHFRLTSASWITIACYYQYI